jgi:sulfur-oxidizing protein SoxY
MDHSRRNFVSTCGLLTALAAAGSKAAELLQPAAPAWNRAAFEAKTVAATLKALGVTVAQNGGELDLTAPEIAEDGAVVPVVVQCRLAGTREIHILVDKNPLSLAASFFFPDGTDPFVSTRIKMSETSNVVALAITDRQAYLARKQIKVTVGGCGG